MPKLHTQRYGATIINDTLGLLLGRGWRAALTATSTSARSTPRLW